MFALFTFYEHISTYFASSNKCEQDGYLLGKNGKQEQYDYDYLVHSKAGIKYLLLLGKQDQQLQPRVVSSRSYFASSTSVNKMVKVAKARTEFCVCPALADKLTSSYPQPFEYLKYAHICFLFLDRITNFQLFFEFEMKLHQNVDDRRLPHSQQQQHTSHHTSFRALHIIHQS